MRAARFPTAKRQLTAVAVEKLRLGPVRREIRDGTGALLLIIQTSGVRSWAMRFKGRHQSRTKSAISISTMIAWDGSQRTAKPYPPQ